MADLIRPVSKAAMVLAIVVIAAALLAPPPASAQALYGAIIGTVADSSGAAVPGATVVATNPETGLKREAVSDTEGSYTFRNLPPGTYDLSISFQGFRELRQTGIRVSPGNPLRVDLKLEVGSLTEAVTVVGESTLLQTEKADLHTELTSKEVRNLPLNQFRNYQGLLNLVPGATPAQFQNAEIDTPGRALRTFVNGTQPNSNAFRLKNPNPLGCAARVPPTTPAKISAYPNCSASPKAPSHRLRRPRPRHSSEAANPSGPNASKVAACQAKSTYRPWVRARAWTAA